ncbi:MAG: phosphoribosylamine--glycine ligase [Planctomycetota bacterium]
MKVLVVGGGGREHALCWKIGQSPLVRQVYCAPGNAGIAASGVECVDIAANNLDGLRAFATDERIDLVVVGPEEPLCAGLVDRLQAASIRVFGPTKKAAEIEGSKAFARGICRRHRIPSPTSWTFGEAAEAMGFLENRPDGPIVVKASGLAAGKGVVKAQDNAAARRAVKEMMEQHRFGAAGSTVVFEEMISGPELSVIALTDGRTIVPLEPARDHKAVFDGDEGPNTGGMGSFSPVASVGGRTLRQIENHVLIPAVHGLNLEERTFRGFLYAGLMLTSAGPRVLEFNARLGDPETQPLMLRLRSDLVPYLLATIEGKLDTLEAPQWDARVALCVMAVSEGYPGEYPKGLPIHGLASVQQGPDLQVFHSGTARRGGDVVTAGGRVLSVTALGTTLEEARARAYTELAKIEFQGMHYRRDIAAT